MARRLGLDAPRKRIRGWCMQLQKVWHFFSSNLNHSESKFLSSQAASSSPEIFARISWIQIIVRTGYEGYLRIERDTEFARTANEGRLQLERADPRRKIDRGFCPLRDLLQMNGRSRDCGMKNVHTFAGALDEVGLVRAKHALYQLLPASQTP